jgi:hypothetical protein
MQIPAFLERMWRLLLLVACLVAAAPATATEPLHDQYADGARTGHIFPSNCCWVELPSNDRIWEIRRKEFGCSAIGGPVGEFKLEDGKLWLTGLMKCSGKIPLQMIYPDMKAPVLAEWLTGTFKTRLDYRCYTQKTQDLYAVTQELVVEKGVVVSLKETQQDVSACATKP